MTITPSEGILTYNTQTYSNYRYKFNMYMGDSNIPYGFAARIRSRGPNNIILEDFVLGNPYGNYTSLNSTLVLYEQYNVD